MKNGTTHIFGGHVSIAGGYAEALPRAKALGGNALQMFSTSPRGWHYAHVGKEEAERFKREAKALGVAAAYFHASYLLNLADDGPNGRRSVEALIAELTVAEALGVKGSIIHLGSFKEEKAKKESLMPTLFENGKKAPQYVKHPRYDLLISNIKSVLQKSPSRTLFIIENMGMRMIGRDLAVVGAIFKDVND